MTFIRGKIRLPNGPLPEFTDFEAEIDDGATPPPVVTLPENYSTDSAVALSMLLQTADRHGWTPISVQGQGVAFTAHLNQDWPGLASYAHRVTDALMWPGFGSVDFTISSGQGGFYFRPDGHSAYGDGM